MHERDAYYRQLFQTFIITMTGFFVTVLLIFQAILPVGGRDSWPLLELPTAATGQEAPATERDVWISVRANGQIFADAMQVDVPLVPNDPTRRVFVRVDRAAPFGVVRAIVRAAQQSGRRKLTFTAVPADTDRITHFFPLPCNDADVQPPVVEHRVMPDVREPATMFGHPVACMQTVRASIEVR